MSTTVEEALLARQRGQAEVTALLETLELRSLDNIRSQYDVQSHANSKQLGNSLALYTDTLQSALKSLEASHATIIDLESYLHSIHTLSIGSKSLIDSHENVQNLSTVSQNVATTLRDVEAIAALPALAAEAEGLLHAENTSLLLAYQKLMLLQVTLFRIESTWKTAAGDQVVNLVAYHNQIENGLGRLEECLWKAVQEIMSTAVEEPATLVAVLQIIEMQEIVDSQLVSLGEDAKELSRCWRNKAFEKIQASIHLRFTPLVHSCLQLPNSNDNHELEQSMDRVFDGAISLLENLSHCQSNIRQCLPPHFGAMPYILDEYSQELRSIIEMLGPSIAKLSSHGILHFLSRIEAVEVEMESLGTQFGKMPESVENLMDEYVHRVASKLDIWLSKIIEGIVDGRLDVAGDGKAFTPGVSDLFHLVNQQVNTVLEFGIKGRLLASMAAEAQRTMRAFQEELKRKMDSGLQLDVMCAIANSSRYSHEAAHAFFERMHEAGCINVNGDAIEVYEGFITLAHHAAGHCVRIVFCDPGLVALFHHIGNTDEWRSGVTLGSIIATLDDFMSDFKRLLQSEQFSMAIKQLLSEAVSHLLAAYLTYLSVATDSDSQLLLRDVDSLVSYFAKYMPEDLVNTRCLALFDLAEFAASDGEEAFLLAYSSLLEVAPGITPTLLSGILNSRAFSPALSMTKAELKEAVEACRDVYDAQQQALSTEFPRASLGRTPVSFLGKNAAFHAALTAARKRR